MVEDNGSAVKTSSGLENRLRDYVVDGKSFTSLGAAIAAGAHRVPDYIPQLGESYERKLSDNSKWTFEQKYLYRDDEGVKEDPKTAVYRMARTMAEVERLYGKPEEKIEELTRDFSEIILSRGFSPAGRIWTNAGTEINGLFNCYVLPVHDSMDLEDPASIFMSVAKAAVIHKNGGGTGYNYSELRPRGAYVGKSKGVASGPISFIGQFDHETKTINSGNRRGANMAILDFDHPDILDFMYAKRIKRQITNFNVSVGITDKFMNLVEKGEFYTLQWEGTPLTKATLEKMIKNVEKNKLGGSEVGEKPEPISLRIGENGTDILDSYANKLAGRINDKGEVQLNARYMFDLQGELAWKTGDPGMIFLDAINRNNPLLKTKGPIKATNPCGEQPLHPYDACNLGSINLEEMLKNENGKIVVDYERLGKTVSIATRFMDNVNDANIGPIKEVEKTVKEHRRIGLGVMGWADMLVLLGIPYDSDAALKTAENVMEFITTTSKKASHELAMEKEVFPAFEGSSYDDGKLENKVRNLQRTTIAPTGTINMLLDVGSGIEPYYAMVFQKNIRGGDVLDYTNKHFEKIARERGFYSKELIEKIKENKGSLANLVEIPDDVRKIFRTAEDIAPEWHIKMLGAFQKHTENAVSKTINLPNKATIKDVQDAYFEAWRLGCKGITVYRNGSLSVQVLTTSEKKKNVFPKDSDGLIGTPEVLPGFRIRQKTPLGNLHGFVAYNPSDGKPLEIFLCQLVSQP